MAALSERARSLFTPDDRAAPRGVLESRARKRLERAGCPPFPAYLDFLAAYAGGKFVLVEDTAVVEFRFSAVEDDLLLTRFGDREVVDPGWLERCRPDMLPGGRGPDDWDFFLGGTAATLHNLSMWPDGSLRMYHGAFSWSQPLATSIEAYLEAKAFVAEAVLCGYSSGWYYVADHPDLDDLIRNHGLTSNPIATSRLIHCWSGPGLRVVLSPATFDRPDMFTWQSLDVMWDPRTLSAADVRRGLSRVAVVASWDGASG